jgi:hypothetical protein
MLSKLSAPILAFGLFGLSACDVIRYPGDGRPAPKQPPAIPKGAPSAPPPLTPVEDPYGTGFENDETDTDSGETNPESDPSDATDVSDTTETPADGAEVDVTETPDDTAEAGETDTDTITDEDTIDSEQPEETGDPAIPAEPDLPVEPAFSYFGPGALLPGSGQGETEQLVHAPDMVFPIKEAPAYLQSMVFTFGGGIGGGDQCDSRNYAYPWRDNFCETRSRNRVSPFCPTAKIHQGQDIRVGTPQDCNTLRRTSSDERALHEVVAVEDGVISHIGSYSVNLRSGGRIYKYMHMNMDALSVEAGDAVSAGDKLGFVSNDFGGTPTTFHLHFEIVENTSEYGWTHVPPYLSLVEAYERREAGFGEVIDAGAVGVATAPIIIPDGFEIIE